MNLTIFQFFHWYYSPEGNLWQQACKEAPHLAKLGVSHVWLPPAYKSAHGVHEPGYAVYDLYDLGEFDQQGSVRTRYGTRKEYQKAIDAFHKNGVLVIADIVLNHKTGGDQTEKVIMQKVDPENRLEKIGEPEDVEAHTKFTFPGRKNKYSDFKWDFHSFTGVAVDNDVYIIQNEHTNGEWDDVPEKEKGNFDLLLGADIELRNPHVVDELKKWGCWYYEAVGFDGVRLDGVKHMNTSFFPDWLGHMKTCFKKDFLAIGEYWKNDVGQLLDYLDKTGGIMQLFDVPLHFNFHHAAQQGGEYDLRKIFDDTLIMKRPEMAITFVDNHDTQPLQSLESYVDYWFKPLAYSLILLREQGIPCVFYPDIYEGKYPGKRGEEEVFIELNKVGCLPVMMKVRKEVAYGPQHDYWDDANMIGWVREGVAERKYSGCVVLMSNKDAGEKHMTLGEGHAGRTFVDVTGGQPQGITLNEKGEGLFTVGAGSVSVWVDEMIRENIIQ